MLRQNQAPTTPPVKTPPVASLAALWRHLLLSATAGVLRPTLVCHILPHNLAGISLAVAAHGKPVRAGTV